MWTVSFILPLFFSVLSWFFFFSINAEASLELTLLELEIPLSFFFFFDNISLIFIFSVSIVSASVFAYTIKYIENSIFNNKFILSLFFFFISIILLSSSTDLFWLIVGWDGLGISSLFLILFFQNWNSFSSGGVTFISNRLGDSFFIFSLFWLLSQGNSKPDLLGQDIFFFFLLLAAISNSAQLPFSAWLPLAMAAPTPVSALVHSSTLVVAGVYLLIRFHPFLTPEVNMVIFFISSLTIFLAGTSAWGEKDVNNIVALSTLSHVGLIIIVLSWSNVEPVVFHFFAHAIFNALIFIVIGEIIHSNSNSQDIRFISLSSVGTFLGVVLIFSLISMSGVPFLVGFFSNEEVTISLSGSESLAWGVLIVAVILTSSYSLRIALSLFCNEAKENSLPSPKGEGGGLYSQLFFITVLGVSIIPSPLSNEVWISHELGNWILTGVFLGAPFFLLKFPFFNNWEEMIDSMWWIGSLTSISYNWVSINSWLIINNLDFKGSVDFFFSSSKSGGNNMINEIVISYLSLTLSSVAVIVISGLSFSFLLAS